MLGFVLATVLGLLACSQGATIPGSWKLCKPGAPDFQACMKEAVAGAVTSLMAGNPSLGVGSLDPLTIKSLAISKGAGPVSINLVLSDLLFSNLKYFEINALENNWKTLKAKLTLPKGLHIAGKYKIDGKVLVLPIKGDGDADLHLDEMTIDAKIGFVEKDVGGTTYYHVEKIDFDFETTRLHIKLDGLFGGDQALGKNMNKFLNDNWKILLAELKKPITEALEQELKDITNQVFDKISKNEITPA